MKGVEKLKMAIFHEWSYDPPTSCHIYYVGYGDKLEDLLEPISLMEDHLWFLVSESGDEEEIADFEKAFSNPVARRKYIKAFQWDNGGLGGDCYVFTEGESILQAIMDFAASNWDWYIKKWLDDEEDADEEALELLNAIHDVKDHDSLVVALDVFQKNMDMWNDRALE